MLYFDQTASTKPYPEVIDRLVELTQTVYANPSALHRLGFQAEQVIKQAARELALDLGVQPSELVFTSGATESINLAIQGYLRAHPNRGSEIVTWACEHKATLATCAALAEQGYHLYQIGTTPEGLPDLQELEAVLSPRTALITFSAVNNELGSILPIERIANLKKRLAPQAVFHVDAVQAWTKLPFRPSRLGIDLASFAGHKIHAPKGIGLLYVRSGLILKPVLYGGGQQAGLRSGTENPVLCSCLALAASIAKKEAGAALARLTSLHKRLWEGLEAMPFAVHINSPRDGSPYLLNVSFPGIKPETLVHALAGEEIYVATHAACSGSAARSHVLDALPLDEEIKTSALRISLSPEHEEADIDQLLEALRIQVPRLYGIQDQTLIRSSGADERK